MGKYLTTSIAYRGKLSMRESKLAHERPLYRGDQSDLSLLCSRKLLNGIPREAQRCFRSLGEHAYLGSFPEHLCANEPLHFLSVDSRKHPNHPLPGSSYWHSRIGYVGSQLHKYLRGLQAKPLSIRVYVQAKGVSIDSVACAKQRSALIERSSASASCTDTPMRVWTKCEFSISGPSDTHF